LITILGKIVSEFVLSIDVTVSTEESPCFLRKTAFVGNELSEEQLESFEFDSQTLIFLSMHFELLLPVSHCSTLVLMSKSKSLLLLFGKLCFWTTSLT
jgi:hypothetical protein